MRIKDELNGLIDKAAQNAFDAGLLDFNAAGMASLERPRDGAHGDWASTLALRLAKRAHKRPADIARIIVDNLADNDLLDSVEIAGPGFINFSLKPSAKLKVIEEVRSKGFDFGKGSPSAHPQKINLEYVSANPTGPMHVGHGRWAALGDSIARIMMHAGYRVFQEFYINDQGVQMDIFGKSIAVRYLQLLGQDIDMPEDSYGGAYVKEIAQKIIDRDADKWLSADEQSRIYAFREFGYALMLQQMKDTLSRFGTHFDLWFSERSLYIEDEFGESLVSRALKAMDERGYIFEKDAATWFRSSVFGDDKDRVLIKADGSYTYFMSDVAYHYDKIQRGFSHLIDIWGADHHGYVARCEAMLAAWGYPGSLEVILGQLVNLFRDGQAVRMSKRTGEMVTFEELIDEVGVDATRFLMLSRSSDQGIDFDIELAKKKDSSNPVYYVQYAHARICSILRRAALNQGLIDEAAVSEASYEDISYTQLAEVLLDNKVVAATLTHDSELALCMKLDEFYDLVELAARDRAPFRVTHYCQELASLFHVFYTNCQVVVEDDSLRKARLALCDAVRIVLALSLSLLGVSAPTRM